MTDLTGKRVLILGAETEVGRAVTTAVAEAGALVAAVAATSAAEAAFAVQRLARRLSSDERKVIAQAIDATNEAAVRVMVRQVSKELGGLDGVVCCETPLGEPPEALRQPPVDPDRMLEWMGQDKGLSASSVLYVTKYAGRELDRKGGGPIVLIGSSLIQRFRPLPKWWHVEINPQALSIEEVATHAVSAIAAPPRSG